MHASPPLLNVVAILVMLGILAFIMAAVSRSRFWVEQWFRIGVVAMGIMVGLWIAAAIGLVQ